MTIESRPSHAGRLTQGSHTDHAGACRMPSASSWNDSAPIERPSPCQCVPRPDPAQSRSSGPHDEIPTSQAVAHRLPKLCGVKQDLSMTCPTPQQWAFPGKLMAPAQLRSARVARCPLVVTTNVFVRDLRQSNDYLKVLPNHF